MRLKLLCFLSRKREDLLADFKKKECEIYLPMFKYEKNHELLLLAMESYFISWINSHLSEWIEHYPNESRTKLYQIVKELLTKSSISHHEFPSNNVPFISKLISSKAKWINSLISMGEKDNSRYRELLLAYEKDKVLFEREMNKLSGGL